MTGIGYEQTRQHHWNNNSKSGIDLDEEHGTTKVCKLVVLKKRFHSFTIQMAAMTIFLIGSKGNQQIKVHSNNQPYNEQLTIYYSLATQVLQEEMGKL